MKKQLVRWIPSLDLVTQQSRNQHFQVAYGAGSKVVLAETIRYRTLFLQNQSLSPRQNIHRTPLTRTSQQLRSCCHVAQRVLALSPAEDLGSKWSPAPQDTGQGQVLDPHPSQCDYRLMQDVSGFQLVPSQWWQTNHPCIFALQPQSQGSTQTPAECPSLQAWLGGADAESATQPAGFRGTLQWGMLQSYFGLEIAFCCFERCRMI